MSTCYRHSRMSHICHISKGLISSHLSILPIKVESQSTIFLDLQGYVQLQTVPELENKYSNQKVLHA
jgi:hypothetical protein